MATARQIARDLVVRLGVTTEAGADAAFDKFGAGIKSIGAAARFAVKDLVAYTVAMRVVEAKLGGNTLHWNIARTAKLVGGLATGAGLATEAFHRFADGLGLINMPLLENAVAIERAAKSLQMSTTDYQTVQLAFEEFGLTAQDVDEVLVKFGANASDALHKLNGPLSQARQEFAKLGISAQELKGRDALGIMELVADKYKGSANKEKAKQAIYKLMGDHYGNQFDASMSAKLVPMLGEGASGITARRQRILDTGQTIPEELLKGAEELVHTFHELERGVEALRNSIGLRLVPAARTLVELARDLFQQNRQWIEQQAEKAIHAFTRAVEILDFVLRNVDWRALLAIWGAYGIMQQAIWSTISFTAHIWLLYTAFQAIRAVLGILTAMFGGLGAAIARLLPVQAAAVAGWWSWATSAGAAAAATLGLEVAAIGMMGALAIATGVGLIFVGVLGALAIVVEDVLTYMRGGPSILGGFLGFWQELLPWVDEAVGLLGGFGDVLWSSMKLAFRVFVELTSILIRLVAIPFGAFMDELARSFGWDSLAEALQQLTGDAHDFADAIDRINKGITGLAERWTNKLNATGTMLTNLTGWSDDIAMARGMGAAFQYATGTGQFAAGGATVNQTINVNGGDRNLARQVGEESHRAAREALAGSPR